MTWDDDMNIKAPSPTEIPLNPANAVPDVLPQERVTGDILRGYGPRRGNLEKLLRYWRPIMRREGGFRRCRAILADHPELYPLEPLCAWLHHETTGLWPNEGCHHPGMKNCRRKLKGIVRGSILSDSDFNKKLRAISNGRSTPKVPGGKIPKVPGAKGLNPSWVEEDDDYAEMEYEDSIHPEEWAAEQMDDDELHKSVVWALKGFMDDEPEWVAHVRDAGNWEHVSEDDDGYMVASPIRDWTPLKTPGGDCGCGGSCGGCGGKALDADCGCGGDMKSLLNDLEIEVKVGKPLSARNLKRIRDAIEALQGLLDETGNGGIQMKDYLEDDDDFVDAFIDADTTELFALKSHLDPVLDYYDLDVEVMEDGILVKEFAFASDEAFDAITHALDAYDTK